MSTNKFLLLIAIISTVACKGAKNNTKAAMQIGGNTDAHGCLVAAGYTWSIVKQNCIRPFEEGITLVEINPTQSYKNASYALIDSAKKQAELFTPVEKQSIILNERKESVFSNNKYTLSQEGKKWVLWLDKQKIYQEEL